MSWSYPIWIARRLFYADAQTNRSSRPAVRVALAGIIIGVLVMIITVCIVVGFKRTITNQIAGFGAHLQIVNFDNNNTYEMLPISFSDSLLEAIQHTPHIQSVTPFITKPGIAKTDSDFLGVVFKSIGDTVFLHRNLRAGQLPHTPNDILISERQASTLGLQPGDRLLSYFVEDEVRVRRFTIAGVYATGFAEYDDLFIWCQTPMLTQLNGWDSTQLSGIQIAVDDVRRTDEVADQLYDVVYNHFDRDGNGYYLQTIRELNPAIFSWLDLLNMNVIVIIILMLCVSGFSIIAGLVILILDAIQLIGTLKALGADNTFVRRIFLTQASMLIFRGMLWGNILGLGLCALQYVTHLFPLDAANYYVDAVPVAFPWLGLLGLNVLFFAVSFLVLLLPAAIVAHIEPSKVMQFE